MPATATRPSPSSPRTALASASRCSTPPSRPGAPARSLEALGKQGRAIGVVLTSGDALEGDLRQLMLDCDGIFLRKPFPPSALLRALEDSLVKAEA